MLELVSISKIGDNWQLSKIVVNPEHISIITEAVSYNNLLREGKIDLGLNSRVTFSKVSMKGHSGFTDLIAIGSPEQILEKINNKTRVLLKG